MKIVIVDDSPADRSLCGALLKELYGSRLVFIETENAENGLQVCRLESPDCVLIDYKLPDMTGIEFLSKLMAQEPSAAVVMLTGIDSGQVAATALKAGAHDFLLKDHITGETLHLAIEKSIQNLTLTRMLVAERERLSVALAEKEVLLKEVHHRVKNNLQVIASLLRMQITEHEDDGLSSALRESQLRVESMAMVHEQLDASDDYHEADLARHAAMLMVNLFASYGVDPTRITHEVAIDRLPLPVDQAIPVGLIMNELVSNALKHAFPDHGSGTIRVECHSAHGQVVLQVTDDGIGMQEAAEAKPSKSLGIEIVRILTHQLKGTFTAEPGGGSITPGSTFRVTFPERIQADGGRQNAAAGK